MVSVQVRDVSPETHEALRRRAAAAGMSLQEYLLATLNDVVARPTVAEVMERAGNRSGGRIGLGWAADTLRHEREHR